MNPLSNLFVLLTGCAVVLRVGGHDLADGPDGHTGAGLSATSAVGATAPVRLPMKVAEAAAGRLKLFGRFGPQVRASTNATHWIVESDGMPDHRMMVGITAWQQQVPLPQPYTGDNAWRIPRFPVPAANPLSTKDHFFRGAIAVAVNGVPIFNPIKNDGRTDTFLAGELDEFGGHCGRADDYHYHIAPTHLQERVGAGEPIAVALDGYWIYGFSEPDGSTVGPLDAFNGHSTPTLGYHYHATRAYPYLNGGFHGEVVERDGQVDPQPRAAPVRPALPPWRGARITGFDRVRSNAAEEFHLEVKAAGQTHHLRYRLNTNQTVTFESPDGEGRITTETHPMGRVDVRGRNREASGRPRRSRQP
jgi:hypothetical protein